mmetsp:Transcript_88812/g.237655  ORF Transcript_88812/g.237655 Transcript_88812/m.237655 type:complete len:112 (+) Transcript_88812:163-498(+)
MLILIVARVTFGQSVELPPHSRVFTPLISQQVQCLLFSLTIAGMRCPWAPRSNRYARVKSLLLLGRLMNRESMWLAFGAGIEDSGWNSCLFSVAQVVGFVCSFMMFRRMRF